jgi:putative endopeptidase
MKSTFLFAALCSLLVFPVAPLQAQGFSQSELCTDCKPCDDFYKYANAGWMAQHPIPDDHSYWGHWDEIIDRNLDILHRILTQDALQAKNRTAMMGSIDQKLGDYFAGAMDTVTLEREGIKPLIAELDRIEDMKSLEDLRKETAHLQPIGVTLLFDFGSDIDPKNSDRMVASGWQGGLGLPEREYYFKQDAPSKEIRAAYIKYVSHLFMLSGRDSVWSFAHTSRVMEIETALARASMTLPEQRDPDSTYHDLTLVQLKALTPHFNWPEYFEELGRPMLQEALFGQPKFLRSMDSLLAAHSMEDWRAYFRWHLLDRASRSLDSKFGNENFAFHKLLSGQKTDLPLWKRRVWGTDGALGEALGQEYIKVAFPPQAKSMMLVMIANLREALRTDLMKLDWIGEATRTKAIEKLNAFVQKIGYPDHWRDYSALQINDGPYILNEFRARKFEFDRNMTKIGKPVDRTEWGMTPSTVNAYYSARTNEIVFPAGILQPPFFDANSDDAYNYGAIGGIIGHEMTHGFDDEGAKFDAKGNLTNWWAPEDLKRFEEKSKCVVKQFDGFTIQDTIHLKGDQVVGESIADLGGVTLAYSAYMKSLEGKPHTIVDGLTPEQRFFIGWARAWGESVRPEAERTQVYTDFHPAAYYRVIGPLSNFPPFAEAFHCAAGDRMVRAMADRCVIW